jgi:hypothetical protein
MSMPGVSYHTYILVSKGEIVRLRIKQRQRVKNTRSACYQIIEAAGESIKRRRKERPEQLKKWLEKKKSQWTNAK